MAELFDFGFTVVNEEELKVTQDAVAAGEETNTKLNSLYEAIIPLLTNLKQNPEKDYIYWPDRVTKIEAFEEHLKGIIS
jgi:hypothetical protein